MITVPRSHHAGNYASYADYAAAQEELDARLDQQRFTPPPKHYADATGRVLLGERRIADAQRAAEEAAGGLVAYLMSR